MAKEFIIQKRKNKWVNTANLNSFLESLEDGGYKATVVKTNKRSNPQNDYLHGLLIPEFRRALVSVGYAIRSDEDAKTILKQTFLKEVITNDVGSKIETVKDTSMLNKDEMSTLFDEVIRFCAENMSYQIPYPGEQMEIDV